MPRKLGKNEAHECRRSEGEYCKLVLNIPCTT